MLPILLILGSICKHFRVLYITACLQYPPIIDFSRKRRKANRKLRQEVKSLEDTPFRLTPEWKYDDIDNVILYVEDPDLLRKMGAKKDKVVIDVLIHRNSKSK